MAQNARWRRAGSMRITVRLAARGEVAHAETRGQERPCIVAGLLGPADITSTADYARLDDAHLIEAADKMGGIVADAMVFSLVTTRTA